MALMISKEKGQVPWVSLAAVGVGYTLIVFLVQVKVIAPLDSPHFRLNLMVPVCVEIASLVPTSGALAWAFLWGSVVDAFSGRFWGGHVGSYLFAVGLQGFAARHLDMGRLQYRVLVVGVCVVAQGLLLAGAALGAGRLASTFMTILAQGGLSLLVAPLVMVPVRAILGVDEA